MAHAISKDAGEFTAQHPAFVAAPRAELANAMAWAKASDELGGEYDRFIEDMVYAPTDKVAGYACGAGVREHAQACIDRDSWSRVGAACQTLAGPV